MEEGDEICLMIRMGVSGRVFLLVLAYLGSPGPKAFKRLCVCVFTINFVDNIIAVVLMLLQRQCSLIMFH